MDGLCRVPLFTLVRATLFAHLCAIGVSTGGHGRRIWIIMTILAVAKVRVTAQAFEVTNAVVLAAVVALAIATFADCCFHKTLLLSSRRHSL